AECHGPEGRGSDRAPSLQTALVRDAPPGTLFWFLTNGNLRHGMPSWSRLPSERRWQLVRYLGAIGREKTEMRQVSTRFASDRGFEELQELDWQRKHDRRVLLGRDLGQRLQVSQRDAQRLRRDDVRRLRELGGCFQLALGMDDLGPLFPLRLRLT